MTYQLHLGIGDDLEKDIREYAGAWGITVSAAARILLRQAIDASKQPKGDSA